MAFAQLTGRYSHLVDKTTGVPCDQTVVLTNDDSFATYPEPFRRVRYYDEELDKRFVFLTNHMSLPARAIADLYRSRWRVELFFKWIKQHLRIKTFYGMSENAVKSQIWIGVSVDRLVAILKRNLGCRRTFTGFYRFSAWPNSRKHLYFQCLKAKITIPKTVKAPTS